MGGQTILVGSGSQIFLSFLCFFFPGGKITTKLGILTERFWENILI